MARVSPKQHSFARGQVSKKIRSRQDTELYYLALEIAKNYVIDGRGILVRRPGTRLLGNTKDNGEARAIPFVFSKAQSYILEFGEDYFRAWFNYGQVIDGGSPTEVVTTYTFAEVEDLFYAQINDLMWITHENHSMRQVTRTSSTTFAIADFTTIDGPYDPPNDNLTYTFEVTGSTLTAAGSGNAPFLAPRDIGRHVRILEEDAAALPSATLEERFQWHFMKITAVTNSTTATVDLTGAAIPASTDWRLGAFYAGEWPSVCFFHENRLSFGKGNKVYMSVPDGYDNFAPSDIDSSVNPDNAITVPIPAMNAKKGAVSDVAFMHSLGFQLVIGTPAGLHTIQSSSFGEGLEPGTAARRPQDSRGAALSMPIMIGESILFIHGSKKKLMGTYYKSQERIGAQDLSLPADDIVQSGIRGIVWQEEPYSIAWSHMDNGTFASLTIQPEEKVQAWATQQLGGRFKQGGVELPPQVESMAVVPAISSGDDIIHMVVKRTINGSDVRFIETMEPYWELGGDLIDAWFLDAALKYEGNTDQAKTMRFIGTGIDNRLVITNFSTPAFSDGQTLMFNDGLRWHHGTIHSVDAFNDFIWFPTKPNAPPGPAATRWHYDETLGWQLKNEGDEIDVYATTYVPPANQTNVYRWSTGITSLSGLGNYEGETVGVFADGVALDDRMVIGGQINDLPDAHIVLVGLCNETKGKLLPVEAGSQTGSSQGKQRPVYEVGIDVLDLVEIEAGTGLPSSYQGMWEQFDPVKVPDRHAVIPNHPPALHSGILRVPRDEQGEVDNPSVAWRQTKPYPGFIRGIITRLSESDGR